MLLALTLWNSNVLQNIIRSSDAHVQLPTTDTIYFACQQYQHLDVIERSSCSSTSHHLQFIRQLYREIIMNCSENHRYYATRIESLSLDINNKTLPFISYFSIFVRRSNLRSKCFCMPIQTRLVNILCFAFCV